MWIREHACAARSSSTLHIKLVIKYLGRLCNQYVGYPNVVPDPTDNLKRIDGPTELGPFPFGVCAILKKV
jgi:hypothetical protein